ncbi:oligosaccharide flippase family protein [Fictibacillus sp. KU28468]|uniref:oligosaccharide flippase family protein n=1 Tax=Fictibacillus sp. KU28468 TaxID=2991053 RepID=UPI00223DBB44|nr:oligosaccharide flippase family protein [Fictibacillus sp. KU28468]UZJ79380.1 oligosaccharide flippase family protein [Fictibacillus sp. KU28468]
MKQNSIAKNIFHLFYSTALSSGLNALALIVLASYLHSYHYGLFSVSLALAMIMGYFTDAGLSEIALREGSKRDSEVPVVLMSYIKVRTILLVLTFLFGFLIIHYLHNGQQELLQTSHYLAVPMVTGIALQSIGTTFFQMIEKMQYIGIIRMLSAVLLVGTISAGMLLSLDPLVMCVLYGSSYLLAGVAALYFVARHVKLKWSLPFHRGMMKHLGFFTLSGLLFMVLPQLGPIVLEKTLTLEQVGLFAVAYRIPQALQQIPFIVAGAYRPVLFRHYHQEELGRHTKEHIMLIKIMALFGMLMTIPFYYGSDVVISLLFGLEWMHASHPLKILSVLLTLQAVNIALADGLTTRGLQHCRTLIQSIAVLSGIALYTGLSLSNGILGAAYAGMLIEAVALIGYWAFFPNRWMLAKKVLFLYLLVFFISLGGVTLFLSEQPYVAAALHLALMSLFLLFDRDLSEKAAEKLQFLKKGRTGGKRGIQDGL